MRKRAIKLTLDKQDKDKDAEQDQDNRPIEEKTEAILKKFEKVGIKIFACGCVFILLDTWRKVQVEKASHHDE
jgi:hypothetical protein